MKQFTLILTFMTLISPFTRADEDIVFQHQTHTLNFAINATSVGYDKVQFSTQVIDQKAFAQHEWIELDPENRKRLATDTILSHRPFILSKTAFVVKNRTPQLFNKKTITSKRFLEALESDLVVRADGELLKLIKTHSYFVYSETRESRLSTEVIEAPSLTQDSWAQFWSNMDSRILNRIKKGKDRVGPLHHLSHQMVTDEKGVPLVAKVTKYYPFDDKHTLIVQFNLLMFPIEEIPRIARNSVREDLPEDAPDHMQGDLETYVQRLRSLQTGYYVKDDARRTPEQSLNQEQRIQASNVAPR